VEKICELEWKFLSLSLYHWQLERWAEGEIEISLQSKLKLKFELEPYEGTYCRENSTCTLCLSQAFYACLLLYSSTPPPLYELHLLEDLLVSQIAWTTTCPFRRSEQCRLTQQKVGYD